MGQETLYDYHVGDQRLCYVHKAMRWNIYLEEARDASAVHAGG